MPVFLQRPCISPVVPERRGRRVHILGPFNLRSDTHVDKWADCVHCRGNDRSRAKICTGSKSVSCLWWLVKNQQTGEYFWLMQEQSRSKSSLGCVFLCDPFKTVLIQRAEMMSFKVSKLKHFKMYCKNLNLSWFVSVRKDNVWRRWR